MENVCAIFRGDKKNIMLGGMHNVLYARNLGYQKTIAAIRSHYFWSGIKKEVANYIVMCLECRKVKT
jgi:hypothetical protein